MTTLSDTRAAAGPVNTSPVNAGAGDARCPGPSTRDIIARDRVSAPAPLLEEHYRFLGDADLPFARYTDPAFHAAELKTVWSRTWQWACREEHVPNAGDFYVYDMGDQSALIVRDRAQVLHAYVNSCPHRGMQLMPAGSHGHGKQFLRCPFHGMSWQLDGTLRDIPCRWDFPHVEDATFGLQALPLAVWGGFVFINFDHNAAPLAEYLGILPEHFAQFAWPLEQRYVALHMEKLLPGNWKMCLEGFLEAYHVLATHPEGLRTAGDANAQYDFWGPNVSRFIHTIGYPSPHLPTQLSEAELFRALGHGDAPLPPGEGAREAHARIMRERLGQSLGIDLSGVSTSQLLDSIQYFLFPNAFFFPGIGIPLIYRFRPVDVDHCIHEVLMLQPVPADQPRPPPAEVVKLGLHDSYTSVPAFVATGLAYVLDQDTENFFQQRAGMKAAHKRGQTLGNYQEARIRHLHQTLDTYMAG
ncbi:MAG: aromatic ring-hydroxylating oxygenase subunit alpha [Gammaproteobacteria bacterium]